MLYSKFQNILLLHVNTGEGNIYVQVNSLHFSDPTDLNFSFFFPGRALIFCARSMHRQIFSRCVAVWRPCNEHPTTTRLTQRIEKLKIHFNFNFTHRLFFFISYVTYNKMFFTIIYLSKQHSQYAARLICENWDEHWLTRRDQDLKFIPFEMRNCLPYDSTLFTPGERLVSETMPADFTLQIRIILTQCSYVARYSRVWFFFTRGDVSKSFAGNI